jgi:hypothetical protein
MLSTYDLLGDEKVRKNAERLKEAMSMLNIKSDIRDEVTRVILLDNAEVRRIGIEALKVILDGLPEEARTVEAVSHVISEMRGLLNEQRISL